MDITGLPNDVFLIIVSLLTPEDCIRCRRVNRNFHYAFTGASNLGLCRFVVQQHYPRAREVRNADEQSDWSHILSKVSARYHFLKAGRPRSIEKIALFPTQGRRRGVAHWRRMLRFDDKTAPFHYADTLWTYDDGLLVFPSATCQQYLLRDFSSSTTQAISVNSLRKVIRRISLRDRLLLLEWCELEPYCRLQNTGVYRHFATFYDIVQDSSGNWTSTFRNEISIHSFGYPLNSRCRFFSVHNQTHYSVFTWEPYRRVLGDDGPFEALAIWDISSPSSYLPSQNRITNSTLNDDAEGVRLVRRFSSSDLNFYRVRQHFTPTLRCLELDEGHLYFLFEDHCWMVGPQAGQNLPRLHKVKSVGIPFNVGPAWQDECGSDGDFNLSFCSRDPLERRVGLAPCWRHEEFPYLTITEAMDSLAGVRFCARQCFMLETMSVSVRPKLTMTTPDCETSFQDDLWQQMLAKGKICGTESYLIGESRSKELVILHFDEHNDEHEGESS